MKGDFTRSTFNPTNHYSGVRMQQGRVQLDADWNEQIDIAAYHSATQAIDVIGPCGAPKVGGGFAISAVDAAGIDFTLSAGRFYVDGILCEASEPLAFSYLGQPDLPTPPALTPVDGQTDLIYLDVWQRHITAIEDPSIREVALGGPDTATRTRTVWQVKVATNVGAGDCTTFQGWQPPTSDGQLTTSTNPSAPSTDPCLINPAGGFRGRENRLYRVEIHDGSASGAPTFKWSRDNGAVAFAVQEFVTGEPTKVKVASLGRDEVLALRIGDWVEVADDASDLAGTPGVLAEIVDIQAELRILTLSKPLVNFAANRHAKVRRWDQKSDALLVAAGPLALEDGIEISFGGTTYQSGDYWTFAARTISGEIEPLTAAPKQGIVHHTCVLGLITWTQIGETWAATIQDCRPQFPALTAICAEDVCFDNGECGLPGAQTVQAALDQLCAARDLRHHNKHLHGWGIVCGLAVECGPDDEEAAQRRNVTVQTGYAISCEGDDLLLNEALIVDVMSGVARLEEENPDRPVLNDKGEGEVCLVLDVDNEQGLHIDIERHDPQKDTLQALLKGTLLMDFYTDCIQEPLEAIRALLDPQDDDRPLVSPAQRQLSTLTNLLIQFNDPQNGQYVYLSAKEDKLLRELYLALRAILQSKTFCAMFDNARPFPDYPLADVPMSTIFSKGGHTRMRLHPDGRLLYTVGTDNMIYVHDVGSEEMVAAVEMPGGQAAIVRDVAFSANGRILYAIAALGGDDTMFAIADINGLEHTWRPVNFICDCNLVTLATVPRLSENVFAIGQGRGFFEINPQNVQLPMQPTRAFNATGHLIISDQLEGVVFATANDNGAPATVYDRALSFGLRSTGAQQTYMLANAQVNTGNDDMALIFDGRGRPAQLALVANSLQSGDDKRVVIFNVRDQSLVAIRPVENERIRLLYVPGSQFLILSYEDSYRLALLELRRDFTEVENYRLPVQVSPLALVHSPRTEQIYALNSVSNTITIIPAAFLTPAEPGRPGSPEFLDALAQYRDGVIQALIDLFGGVLQYLKDCLCHHFLVKCPECGPDDKIYLACVSVRDRQVYKVCNFSQRKYVKSFPTVGYWLSIVPIMPFIDKAIELFCCTILPDFFSRQTTPKPTAYKAQVKGVQILNAMDAVRKTNLRQVFQQQIGQISLARNVTGDWAGTAFTEPVTRRRAVVTPGDVTGQPLERATKVLQEARVEVAGIEQYKPNALGTNLVRLPQAGLHLAPGTRVTLYEENGIVRYYAIAKARQPALEEIEAKVAAQATTLAGVATLKNSLVEMQNTLAQKDQELSALRTQLADVQARQSRVEQTPARTKLAELETELQSLRSFREEVTKFMAEKRK